MPELTILERIERLEKSLGVGVLQRIERIERQLGLSAPRTAKEKDDAGPYVIVCRKRNGVERTFLKTRPDGNKQMGEWTESLEEALTFDSEKDATRMTHYPYRLRPPKGEARYNLPKVMPKSQFTEKG